MSTNPKLTALIAYILENFNDSELSDLKLHKLLYFIEVEYYIKFGDSITNCNYYRNDHGPTVDYNKYKSALKFLIDGNYIKIDVRGKYKYYDVLDNFDNIQLSEDVKVIVTDICTQWYGKKAYLLRKRTHYDAPFLATNDEEKRINFRSAYQRFDEKDLKPTPF